MSKPLVSVVMVVRNMERFLAEAIESILAQTFTGFEFIIVDFGSQDKSKTIVTSYAAKDARLRFHEVPVCSLPQARNIGCSLAEGTYIAVMDADDVSIPDRLQWQIEFADNHPEVGAIGGAVEWIDAVGTPLQKIKRPLSDSEIRSALLTQSVLWHPSALIRRDVFVQLGGYRPVFVVAHDYDLWLRIAERSRLANLEQVVLKYRIHSFQLSVASRRQQTLCKLAAQVSASWRRQSQTDPLDTVRELTPTLLAELGVTEVQQHNELAFEFRQWARVMSAAGEYSGAISAIREILQSDVSRAEPWQIADLHIMAASLYWRMRRPLQSILSLSHAALRRPAAIGRPLKPLLRPFLATKTDSFATYTIASGSPDSSNRLGTDGLA